MSTMTDDQTYNGWTNYATWGVALVLDNEQATQEAVLEQLAIERASVKSDGNVIAGIWGEADAVEFRMADWLKDYVEDLCGLEGWQTDERGQRVIELPMMARQVIQAGLAEVDWEEIARHYTDES